MEKPIENITYVKKINIFIDGIWSICCFNQKFHPPNAWLKYYVYD